MDIEGEEAAGGGRKEEEPSVVVGEECFINLIWGEVRKKGRRLPLLLSSRQDIGGARSLHSWEGPLSKINYTVLSGEGGFSAGDVEEGAVSSPFCVPGDKSVSVGRGDRRRLRPIRGKTGRWGRRCLRSDSAVTKVQGEKQGS